MENFKKINLDRTDQCGIVNDFISYYQNRSDTAEINSVSLISHHDTSIRFTNSTTSVMKPYLIGDQKNEKILYMSQPAMGQQGLEYWRLNKKFGPYASYFMSLGALYPSHYIVQSVVSDMIDIASNWNAEMLFSAHEQDLDIINAIKDLGVSIKISSGDVNRFRQRYGLGDIVGRNANLLVRNAMSVEKSIGHLAVINGVDGAFGSEISFDSANVAYLSKDYDHPVLSHSIYKRYVDEESIARLDFLSVISALLFDGLRPISRGRSGVLRKFLLEYVNLMKINKQVSIDDITNSISRAVIEECCFRECASPSCEDKNHLSACNLKDIGAWVTKLYYQDVNKK